MRGDKIKTISYTLFLAIAFSITGCEISSVDYAIGDVKLISKAKTIVGGKPAIRLTIINTSVIDAFNVTVTVKAKRNQMDIEIKTAIIEKLKPDEIVKRVVVLNNLSKHDDYDFLTYAVNFSH